jgi:hypothetical protein
LGRWDVTAHSKTGQGQSGESSSLNSLSELYTYITITLSSQEQETALFITQKIYLAIQKLNPFSKVLAEPGHITLNAIRLNLLTLTETTTCCTFIAKLFSDQKTLSERFLLKFNLYAHIRCCSLLIVDLI